MVKIFSVRHLSLSRLVTLSLLIALTLVIGRFSVGTNLLKVSFTFVGMTLIGYFYGPFWTGLAGFILDLLGIMMSSSGVFYPGFTLSAIVAGIIYGGLLDARYAPIHWWRLLTVSMLISLGINGIVTTLWLTQLSNLSFWSLFMMRLPKEILTVPVMFIVMKVILDVVQRLKLMERIK